MTIIAHPWDINPARIAQPSFDKRRTLVQPVCPIIEARVAAQNTEFVRIITPSGRSLYMAV